MLPLTLEYPHVLHSAVPARLSAREVWLVAIGVRNQLLPDRIARRVELDQMIAATAQVAVNGISFAVEWDLDHEVLSETAAPVMGVTEFDPVEPGSIMVSINGRYLKGDEALLRSTAAHELGHVVFDAPSWITRAGKPGSANYAAITPQDHASETSQPLNSARLRGTKSKQRQEQHFDSSEFRANEFMGALLAPPGLLGVELQRFARARRWPASSQPSRVQSAAPAYDAVRVGYEASVELLCTMAETFGVSESFIRVRLARYDLFRTEEMFP
jgi:hypothetical protein